MTNDIKQATNSLLLSFVKSLFIDQINSSSNSYVIGIGSDYRAKSEFNYHLAEKYGCQLILIDKRTYDAPLSLLISLDGKLRDVFIQYGIAPYLFVEVDSGEDDNTEFSSEKDLNKIKRCRPLAVFLNSNELLEDFHIAVSKATLFTVIRNS